MPEYKDLIAITATASYSQEEKKEYPEIDNWLTHAALNQRTDLLEEFIADDSIFDIHKRQAFFQTINQLNFSTKIPSNIAEASLKWFYTQIISNDIIFKLCMEGFNTVSGWFALIFNSYKKYQNLANVTHTLMIETITSNLLTRKQKEDSIYHTIYWFITNNNFNTTDKITAIQWLGKYFSIAATRDHIDCDFFIKSNLFSDYYNFLYPFPYAYPFKNVEHRIIVSALYILLMSKQKTEETELLLHGNGLRLFTTKIANVLKNDYLNEALKICPLYFRWLCATLIPSILFYNAYEIDKQLFNAVQEGSIADINIVLKKNAHPYSMILDAGTPQSAILHVIAKRDETLFQLLYHAIGKEHRPLITSHLMIQLAQEEKLADIEWLMKQPQVTFDKTSTGIPDIIAAIEAETHGIEDSDIELKILNC